MCGNGSKIVGIGITIVHLQMSDLGKKRMVECGQRVVRGGSWYNEPVNLRASARDRLNAVNRGFDIGFRLAQDLE